ncbi:MAG: YicC/YloC family endoribonuclease, partial [Armatimonadaceae bacterium]
MLLSMTGFGSARGAGPAFAVAVEVRAVNNRHLKLTVRGTDPYPLFESELEKVVRGHVRRGSVHLQVKVDRATRPADFALNTAALAAYKRQVIEACDGLDATAVNAVLSGLLGLPGVAPEAVSLGGLPEDEWPVVEQVLREALAHTGGNRTAAAKLLGLDRATLRTKLR